MLSTRRQYLIIASSLAYAGIALITLPFVFRERFLSTIYGELFMIFGQLMVTAAMIAFFAWRSEYALFDRLQSFTDLSRAGISELKTFDRATFGSLVREIFTRPFFIQIAINQKNLQFGLIILDLLADVPTSPQIRILVGADYSEEKAEGDSPTVEKAETALLVHAIAALSKKRSVEAKLLSAPTEFYIMTEDSLLLAAGPRTFSARESLLLRFTSSSKFAAQYMHAFERQWQTAEKLSTTLN